ncbi:hypothetical protein GR138_26345 [Shinella kummerowiae]|jgi:hypothetical protein|uniref:Uncharacterized protein n=1 Tax=Shinella kummerowiae TaxID=417745 RepID=A0A6N8SI21_9HYPH|nr:hypothetical protein [Shinella kummerowiae]MXN48724.1 hypothetical protein [Shinella kummerowiae]
MLASADAMASPGRRTVRSFSVVPRSIGVWPGNEADLELVALQNPYYDEELHTAAPNRKESGSRAARCQIRRVEIEKRLVLKTVQSDVVGGQSDDQQALLAYCRRVATNGAHGLGHLADRADRYAEQGTLMKIIDLGAYWNLEEIADARPRCS